MTRTFPRAPLAALTLTLLAAALAWTSVGSGSLGHLSSELFRAMAGIQVTQVFYKGAPQVMTALIGNVLGIAILAVIMIPLINSIPSRSGCEIQAS